MARLPKSLRAEPQRAPLKPRGLPSQEDLLQFMSEAKGKVGKREIARAFGLKGGDKLALKQILRDLEEKGQLERRRKGLHKAGELPNVVVADIIGRDDDGELIAEPAEWEADEQGKPPRILVHLPRRVGEKFPAPGVGDRALLRVEKNHDGEGPPYTGRVVKMLSKRRDWQIGVFRAMPDGSGRITSIDKKALGRELTIQRGDTMDAKDGDLVTVETGRDSRLGLRQARVRERLGSLNSERAISLIAIHSHGIPDAFKPATLAEAESVRPATMKGREDWRKRLLVTIDPPDAKDHDDAVLAEPDTDPDNVGGFILTVAIADVSAYVRPRSAMDSEAIERGNSVYFPDRVVPMLPERISNDLCSLRPREDRPALAVEITIDKHGRKLRHDFHRVMMNSVAKLAYAQAQAAIDGQPDDTTGPLLETVLKPLYAAYDALKIARSAREPLDLDLPERKLVLNPDGTVKDVVTPERLDAHRLIEEFMILANVCAAESLEKAQAPVMYRVHDSPSLEKLMALREFLESVSISLPKAGALRPSQFNRILASAAKTESSHLINEVVLRSQAQAEYSPENYGHFGLNLRRYAHFTSPIRRYSDLIVHRSLIRALKLGDDGLPDTTLQEMKDIGQRISAAERRAMTAERETVDRLIAHFLADQVGATFEGRISGVTGSGVFVKLRDTGADGYVPAATLGADYYRFDEAQRALIGSRTGEAFRLGDQVTVKLVEALPVAGALRFEILSQGRYMKSGATKRGRQRILGKAASGRRDNPPDLRRGSTSGKKPSQKKKRRDR